MNIKNQQISYNLILPILIFSVAFIAIPLSLLDFMKLMPGDIGDSRLNNYFLENIYQFVIGKSNSLWHLNFFHPYPYIIGLSDNLFGASPIYVVARVFTGESDTAFQIWYLFGYIANFFATYYVLRELGGNQVSSSAGALIFTFALSTTAHANHVQLHYRFAAPLALYFFLTFTDKYNIRYIIYSGGWLAVQFYCGIYMGFFTLLMIAIASLSLMTYYSVKNMSITTVLLKISDSWKSKHRHQKVKYLVYALFIFISMIVLFYPYLWTSVQYGASRRWGEIAAMLPRVQSYFLSDNSVYWSLISTQIGENIPMRHEHQMFPGLIPLLIALHGVYVGWKYNCTKIFWLMCGTALGLFLLTLNSGGISLWILFYKLPLASAIRAMTRFDQLLLFPIAYFAVLSINHLSRAKMPGPKSIYAVLLLFVLVADFSLTKMPTSSKVEWRDRIAAKQKLLTKQSLENDILFFAQGNGPYFAEEIDSMWLSLLIEKKTLNGYSGNWPPGYDTFYKRDCAQLPKRVISYLNFMGKSNSEQEYLKLINSTTPIGFRTCNDNWFTSMPNFSTSNKSYSKDDFKALSYQFSGVHVDSDEKIVTFTIHNAGAKNISALSSIDRPVRVSWLIQSEGDVNASDWKNRMPLPFDIPAYGHLKVELPIKLTQNIADSLLHISLVQEGVFWAHDIGVDPLRVQLDKALKE